MLSSDRGVVEASKQVLRRACWVPCWSWPTRASGLPRPAHPSLTLWRPRPAAPVLHASCLGEHLSIRAGERSSQRPPGWLRAPDPNPPTLALDRI